MSEAPEGYDSVKGVKSTEDRPSFFKVRVAHLSLSLIACYMGLVT